MRSGLVQGLAAFVLASALTGCVSTVSFKVSPDNHGRTLLSCAESSTGVCKFNVTGLAPPGTRTYRVAVGQSVTVPVPDAGLDVHGCVADKAFPSCSGVHVAPTTHATSDSKGW